MAGLKVPPNNEEAEQSVLGAILIDKDAIATVSSIIAPSDFYNPVNGMIFGAMLSLYEQGKPIDILTLRTAIKKNKNFKNFEQSYLTELINVVPTAANIEHYAIIIKDAGTKRALIHAGSLISEMGFGDDKEIDTILDRAESSIFAISQKSSLRSFIPLKEALAESFDRIDELHKKGAGLRGIKTGFVDLDNTLSGMQRSNLLILAARPGQGKTAMIVNIAQHAAVVDKTPVAIFSLEMSKEELVDRLLVGQADVDAWRLNTGKLTDDDTKAIVSAMGELVPASIFIDDTPGISILEMRTKARKLKAERGLDLVIVDYLQLADAGRRFESRVQEVTFISQGLKNLARELQIPVLSLSQLSRAVEQRGVKKPQLADLRDSGAIEQDADVVLFIYQEQDSEDLLDNNKRIVKVNIAKHRNGPTGELELMFRGDRVKFYSVDKSSSI